MRTFIALFTVFLITASSLCSQSYTSLKEYETILQQSFKEMLPRMPDSQKLRLNSRIEGLMAEVLRMPGAFVYPFDSLKNIGRITSRDEKLRLFTWDLLFSDGSHQYTGWFLYLPKNAEKPLLFRLTDNSAKMPEAEKAACSPESWYGALYYEIIERKWNDRTLYTLPGYDPNNIFISRKIIDCLYMKDDTIPVFGAPVFVLHNKIQHRVIYEYSAKVSMSLRYNENLKMIVFDHLSPAKPSYTGNYQFYGPDFSFDAFKFTDGMWVLMEDVDVRNQ